jgi:hypothetical protein
MKIVKIILIVIGVLVAIPLLIAIFVKKEYSVAREVTINKPQQDVFNYIKFIKNQDNYNKWMMIDPNVRKQFSGVDGTPGFTYAWDSDQKELGAGKMTITSVTGGQRIDYQVHFIRPFENDANLYMATEKVADNQTKVKWVFSGKNPYPMNFMNLFIDGMLGKDLATSLDNLKAVVERS